jgi:hypothetical protein
MATKKRKSRNPEVGMQDADLRRHIGQPLKRQFAHAFEALRGTIRTMPRDEWCRGEEKADQPVRQAAHLLLAVENALGGHHGRVGKRFGVPVESFKSAFDPVDCPAPRQFLPWIDQVERIANAHIDRAVEMSITGSAKQHPPLNRPTYILRHTAVHLAILRQELKRRGIKRPRW